MIRNMKKIRIAVFGIRDAIWEVIKDEIDPQRAEIVVFLENDEAKQGVCYMNIPVAAPSRKTLDEYAADAYLITALSAYGDIKRQLMELGVFAEQIHLFVAKDICKFCLGPVDDIDENFVQKIYFEPDEIIGIAAGYKEMYEQYSRIMAYDETNGWFYQECLISHACGGCVDGRRIAYSNSKEAFLYCIEQKFRLMECDMLRMNNGELVLGHDYRCFYDADMERYSVMTAEDLLHEMKKNKTVRCLIDVKWKDHREYRLILEELERLIGFVTDNDGEKEALKKRIIMEVYDETTIKLAFESNFQMIFTQYRNPDWRYFMNTAVMCSRYGIRAVALAVASCFEMKRFLHILTDKNINIFAFSTDSIEEYSRLRKMGVTGVFTNYLIESNVSEI